MGNFTERISALSDAKRELLELKFASRDAAAIKGGIPRLESRHSLPLSFAQQQLWFLDRFEPNSGLYNETVVLQLGGDLNIPALGQALDAIVARHESLRTTFAAVDGVPVQVIGENRRAALKIIDVTGAREQAGEVQHLLQEEASRPFDLSADLMLRSSLFRLGPKNHLLIVVLHHIASDGWSVAVFLREVSSLYEAFADGKPSPLADLPVQYAEYSAWQRDRLRGTILPAQLPYWRHQLSGIQPLQLPTDRPRAAVQTHAGATQAATLSPALTEKLRNLSRAEGVTLFALLLAVFQILLHRYAQCDDIVVGSPVAARNRTEIEGLIGFFANNLVLRTDFAGDPTCRELLKRVWKTTVAAYSHQDVPFETLVQELQPERNLSHSPLFQVMFSLQNIRIETPSLAGLDVKLMPVKRDHAKFELTLEMTERGGALEADIEYNTDLFDAATITRMHDHYRTLLESFLADPQQRLSRLPMLSKAETDQILISWNDTGKGKHPKDACIHELFETQAARTPSAEAAAFKGAQLSYRELNCRANQLARHLQKCGVGPDVLVGVCVERSLEMAVALLAVLKAGGAYVPLDPMYPKERLAFMIDDAQAPVLLTQERLQRKLPKCGSRMILVDTGWKSIAEESEKNPACQASAESLAYVIYTSGTTGRPKGVQISHRGLTQHSLAAIEHYGLKQTDRILQFASLSFDVAAEEIFPSWLSGASVVLPPEQTPTISDFLQFLERERVTVADLPVAYWHEWVSEIPHLNRLPAALRLLIVGNDRVSPRQYALWQKTFGDRVRWINAYGPTEAVITSTLYKAPSSGNSNETASVPIGRPIAGKLIYILDRHLQPVPVGVPGEIHIGGATLARGYLNDPAQTAEKFIPNPFDKDVGGRLYKSGDNARYLPDGTIDFLGRIDDQVKIRGFRIELGEIETALKQYPAVQDVVIVVREENDARPPAMGEAVDDSKGHDDPEALFHRITSLDPDLAEHLLSEVEELSGNEAETPPVGEVPLVPKGAKTTIRKFPEFNISLELTSDTFISPPQQSQRNWIVQQALDEISDDLHYLDKLSKRFVAGSERAQIQNEWRRSEARYDQSQLLIEGQQVMQDWERPLMATMAQFVAETHGDVLEIGFGMGISASHIQELGVKSHTIVECNQDVGRAFAAWKERYPGRDIRLLEGKWQEVVERLGTYDGIFFDAYPLNEDEFREHVINSVTFAEHFFAVAARCLRRGGVFTYYTNEIDSLSRRHQRRLFDHFSSLTMRVVKPLRPPEDCNYWWADSMVAIKAVK